MVGDNTRWDMASDLSSSQKFKSHRCELGSEKSYEAFGVDTHDGVPAYANFGSSSARVFKASRPNVNCTMTLSSYWDDANPSAATL